MKRTGPTNAHLRALISELKKQAIEKETQLWKRIAVDLEKPTRKRRVVNLSRINRHTKDSDIVVVPGKILSAGALQHKLTVAAYNFSMEARKKIEAAGGEALSIQELLQKQPDGKNIRIIG